MTVSRSRTASGHEHVVCQGKYVKSCSNAPRPTSVDPNLMKQLPPDLDTTPGPDQAYFEVSALEAGIIRLQTLHLFIQGASTEEISICPSLAFSLRHRPSDAHLEVFDLRMRRDTGNYAPAVLGVIRKWMPVECRRVIAERRYPARGRTDGHS